MKLSGIVSSIYMEYCYRNLYKKIPTWVKLGDNVRGLMDGRIYTIKDFGQRNAFLVTKNQQYHWKAAEFFEKADK